MQQRKNSLTLRNSKHIASGVTGAVHVVVGARTKIRLVPHLGEFDEAALWSRRLGYEDAAFLWLESNTADRYDIIVEIGANVGVL